MYSYINKGVSLWEMLITLLVISILASIAIPTFHYVMAHSEAMVLKSDLNTALNFSKINSVSLFKRIGICGTRDGLRCASDRQWNHGILIFYDNKIKNRVLDEGEQIIRYHKFNLKYGTLQWRGFGVAGNLIFHEQAGGHTGSNGSFYYCSHHNAALSFKIVVSPNGFIRTEKDEKC